jgi:hypothetical protein
VDAAHWVMLLAADGGVAELVTRDLMRASLGLLALAALGASALDGGAMRAAESFAAWFRSRGGQLHPSLEFVAFRSKAAQDKAPDAADLDRFQWKVMHRPGEASVLPSERLLDVPAEFVLSPPMTALISARDDFPADRAAAIVELESHGFGSTELLALELLLHASNGTASAFGPFVQTLPSDEEVNAL